MLKIKTRNCDKNQTDTSIILTPIQNDFEIKIRLDIENLKETNCIGINIYSENKIIIEHHNEIITNEKNEKINLTLYDNKYIVIKPNIFYKNKESKQIIIRKSKNKEKLKYEISDLIDIKYLNRNNKMNKKNTISDDFIDKIIYEKNINIKLNEEFNIDKNDLVFINKIKNIINTIIINNKNENFYKEIIKISSNNKIDLLENIPFYEFRDVKKNIDINFKFCIIIPSYNNEKNIRNNLISIFYQNYTNYRIIYTNDNSNDKTEELFYKIVKEFNASDRVTYKKNDKRMFQSYSKYMSYQMINDDEIVVILDGDDWLSRNDVLETIKNHYKNTGCKVTYSNFLMYESDKKTQIIKSEEYPEYVKKNASYRKYPKWLFYHLRTGYGYLFKNIPKNYLKYNGDWLDRVTDQAEMFCVGEMAGDKVSHIDEVLHIYNKANSILYPNSHYNDANSEIRKQIENYIKNDLKQIK